MSRLRLITLALPSLIGAFVAGLAGSASASSWQNYGNTSFNATATAVTVTGSSSSLSCSSGSLTGSAGTSSSSATWSNVFVTFPSFNGCRIGGAPTTLSCTIDYTAQAILGGTPASILGVANIGGCFVTGTTCQVFGTVWAATYTNPNIPAGGTWSLGPTTGLTTTGSGCILGSGSTSMTKVVFTVTSGTGGFGSWGPSLGRI